MNRNLNEISLNGIPTAKNIVKSDNRDSSYTCCNEHRKVNGQITRYTWADHILDSNTKSRYKNYFELPYSQYIITSPYKNIGSDHCPIYAEVPF